MPVESSASFLELIMENSGLEHKLLVPSGQPDRHHLLPSQQQQSRVNTGKVTEDDKWQGAFYFVHAADTQFGMIDSYLRKLSDPKWEEELRLTGLFIEACNRLEPRPKFVVVCGDLVDAWPGTALRREQVADFKRLFGQLDSEIPLVCVCGNHDIGNEPTPESLEEYKRDFGADYFYFTTNEVLFIVINSQFYQHRANVKEYAAEHDKWLERALERCKQFKYSIVFEHIPWFLKNFDEEDEYFNIERQVRLNWLRKFQLAGVNKIMCGHYHRNAGGWYGDMELVVTSAVGAQLGDIDKSGARIVRVLENSIEHQYYALEELPTKVNLVTRDAASVKC